MLLSTGAYAADVETSVNQAPATQIPAAVQPPAKAVFDADQQKAIQQIVHDYIVNQPQVLVEASNNLRIQQQKQWTESVNKKINENVQKIFLDPANPVAGNAKSDIVMVEFFDYQCIHCKKMVAPIDKVIKSDPNLKVIFISYPIFGETSLYAAKAALAAEKQGKFLVFHDALMNATQPLSPDLILKIANEVKLNTAQLQKDMNDPAIDEELKNNRQLGQDLMLGGTPTFIFAKLAANNEKNTASIINNPLIVPGEVSEAGLKKSIEIVTNAKS